MYISDSLTNQTITEIENNIVGVDDELQERFDKGEDQIRKITDEDRDVCASDAAAEDESEKRRKDEFEDARRLLTQMDLLWSEYDKIGKGYLLEKDLEDYIFELVYYYA